MYFVLHSCAVPVMSLLAVVLTRWQQETELNSVIIKIYFEWTSCNSTATRLPLFYSALVISFQPVLWAKVPLIFCHSCGCWVGTFISSSVTQSDGIISAGETALNLFHLLLFVLFFILYSTLCICVVFVNLCWLYNWHLCCSASTSIPTESNWTELNRKIINDTHTLIKDIEFYFPLMFFVLQMSQKFHRIPQSVWIFKCSNNWKCLETTILYWRRRHLLPWICRENVPSKRWQTPKILHSVLSQ